MKSLTKKLYEGILNQGEVLDGVDAMVKDTELYKNGVKNQNIGTCIYRYNNLAPTRTQDGLEYYLDWKRMKRDLDKQGAPSYDDMMRLDKKHPENVPVIRLYSQENHESIYTLLRFILNRRLQDFYKISHKNRPEELIEDLNSYIWSDKRKEGAEFSVFGSLSGMYVKFWVNLNHIVYAEQKANRNYSSKNYLQLSCQLAIPKRAFNKHLLPIK
jgi:hypothetical protein